MNRLPFALPRTMALAISTILVLALAACGGGTGAPADPTDPAEPGAVATVTDGVAQVVAEDLSFDVDRIVAPAGEAFTIRLTNNENVPHNLSVYVEEGGERIALGEIINEGQTDEIEVSALEPGEYFFVCDLHAAEMRGTLVVEG